MQGIPTYTQHTVAFPTLPLREHVVDDVSVSFAAKGGGTHGEFTVEWVGLSSFGPHGAFRVKAFGDGLGALLDPRILGLMEALRKMDDEEQNEVSPARFIEMLEAAGVRPSIYHLRGLDDGNLSLAEKDKLEKRMAALRKHGDGE
jgi:hypothetical protein